MDFLTAYLSGLTVCAFFFTVFTVKEWHAWSTKAGVICTVALIFWPVTVLIALGVIICGIGQEAFGTTDD